MKLIMENWRSFSSKILKEVTVDDEGYPLEKDPETGEWVRTGKTPQTGKTATATIPLPGSKIRVERQRYPGGMMGGRPGPLYRGYGVKRRGGEGNIAYVPGGVEEQYLSFNKVLVIPGGQFTLIKWLADSGDPAAKKIIEIFGSTIVSELESESLYAIYDTVLGKWAKSQGFDAINFTDKINKDSYEQHGEIVPGDNEWQDLRTGLWWTDDREYANTYSQMASKRTHRIKSRLDIVEDYISKVGPIQAKLRNVRGPGGELTRELEVAGGLPVDKLESESQYAKGADAVDIQPGEVDPNPTSAALEGLADAIKEIEFLSELGMVEDAAAELRRLSREFGGYPEELKKAYEMLPAEVKSTLELHDPSAGLPITAAPSISKPMAQRKSEFEAQMKALGEPIETMTAKSLEKDPTIYRWREGPDDIRSFTDPEYEDYIYNKYDVVVDGPRTKKGMRESKLRGKVEKASCRNNTRLRIKIRL